MEYIGIDDKGNPQRIAAPDVLPVEKGGTGKTTTREALESLMPEGGRVPGAALVFDGERFMLRVPEPPKAPEVNLPDVIPPSMGGTGLTTPGAHGVLCTVPGGYNVLSVGEGVFHKDGFKPVDLSSTTGVLPVSRGGTGTSDARSALEALLPEGGRTNGAKLTWVGNRALWEAEAPEYADIGYDAIALNESGFLFETAPFAIGNDEVELRLYYYVVSSLNAKLSIKQGDKELLNLTVGAPEAGMIYDVLEMKFVGAGDIAFIHFGGRVYNFVQQGPAPLMISCEFQDGSQGSIGIVKARVRKHTWHR